MCLLQLCIFLMKIHWFWPTSFMKRRRLYWYIFISSIIISVQHAALLNLWLSHFKANRLFKHLQHTHGHFTKQLIYFSKWSQVPRCHDSVIPVALFFFMKKKQVWLWVTGGYSLMFLFWDLQNVSAKTVFQLEYKLGPMDSFRHSTSRNTRYFLLSSSAASGCPADGWRDSGGFASPVRPKTQHKTADAAHYASVVLCLPDWLSVSWGTNLSLDPPWEQSCRPDTWETIRHHNCPHDGGYACCILMFLLSSGIFEGMSGH